MKKSNVNMLGVKSGPTQCFPFLVAPSHYTIVFIVRFPDSWRPFRLFTVIVIFASFSADGDDDDVAFVGRKRAAPTLFLTNPDDFLWKSALLVSISAAVLSPCCAGSEELLVATNRPHHP